MAKAKSKKASAGGEGGTAVAEREPVEKPKKGAATAFTASEDRVVEVLVKEIASNSQNPRESAPNLIQMGYGLFNKLEGSDKPAVIPLALSEKPDEKAEFVKLVDKFEPDLAALANDFKVNGMIQPTRVRIVPNGYDLIVGCRRVLAALYNHAKNGDPASVRAIITERNDDQALYMSFSENAHRLQMNPMEQARWFSRLRNAGLTVNEIEEKTKVDHQVVRQRLALLKLPTELQGKVEEGELGVVKALKIVKGKEDGSGKKPGAVGKGHTGDGSRRKVPSIKEFETMYSDDAGLHEEVRKWIAKTILGVDYVTFARIQKEKERAAGTAAKE